MPRTDLTQFFLQNTASRWYTDPYILVEVGHTADADGWYTLAITKTAQVFSASAMLSDPIVVGRIRYVTEERESQMSEFGERVEYEWIIGEHSGAGAAPVLYVIGLAGGFDIES